MTDHVRIGLAAVLLALAGGPLAAAEGGAAAWATEKNGVRVATGLTYATAGGEPLKLDLAVPPGPGPHPLVVAFHGGAWRIGDRSMLSRLIRDLAAHGYAAATVGYRLAPAHRFPAQIEDAKTAVRFLRSRAKEFGLDPTRVAAAGFSAGAHLAALLGTTTIADGFDGKLYPNVSSAVNCVLDYFGPTDLALYAGSEGLVDAYMVPFLGKACKTDPAAYRKASPIEYVSKASRPTLIVHGTADLLVPVIHSERYAEKLTAAGVPVEFVTVPGGGHPWVAPASWDVGNATLRFLDRYLKGAK